MLIKGIVRMGSNDIGGCLYWILYPTSCLDKSNVVGSSGCPVRIIEMSNAHKLLDAHGLKKKKKNYWR